MATTYKANSTFTYLIAGSTYSVRSYVATYSVTRAFVRYDTSTITADLADITAVDLVVNVESLTTGGCTALLQSSISSDSNDWGTTITNTVGDFASTNSRNEGTAACTSTGVKTFSVDKTHLDLSGVTWFRIRANSIEYTTTSGTFRISSENNANSSLRPYLRITYSSGAVQYIPQITII